MKDDRNQNHLQYFGLGWTVGQVGIAKNFTLERGRT